MSHHPSFRNRRGEPPCGSAAAAIRRAFMSSKEVAVVLNISVKTAETHRANIMRKLELHSVSELVRYAVKNQIIEV